MVDGFGDGVGVGVGVGGDTCDDGPYDVEGVKRTPLPIRVLSPVANPHMCCQMSALSSALNPGLMARRALSRRGVFVVRCPSSCRVLNAENIEIDIMGIVPSTRDSFIPRINAPTHTIRFIQHLLLQPMSLSVSSSRPVVGVVGAGVVGTHLCVDLVARGYAVSVYDTDAGALAKVLVAVPGNQVRACSSLDAVCEACQVLFVAVPTPATAPGTKTNGVVSGYQLHAVHATMAALVRYEYAFPVLLKCTMCPGTTDALSQQYSSLWLFHVPEFLSSRTASIDTLSPTQPLLLLGVPDGNPVAMAERVRVFLEHCANGRQRVMTMRARETEATKLFCNVFYAAKVQVFNEFYALCGREGVSYDLVRHTMLQQGWMHPMHTQVPGPNGALGFGGACLPKDATALAQWAGPTCPMLTRLGQTPSARGHQGGAQ